MPINSDKIIAALKNPQQADKLEKAKQYSFWQRHILKKGKTAESPIVWPMYLIMLFVFAFSVAFFSVLAKCFDIYANLFAAVSLCLGVMVAYPVQALILSKLYWEKAPSAKYWKRAGIAIVLYVLSVGIYFLLESGGLREDWAGNIAALPLLVYCGYTFFSSF